MGKQHGLGSMGVNNLSKGAIIICALSGDFGKPRPSIIVQSDLFLSLHSVVVCPITFHIINAPLFRVLIHPSEENGLKALSQIMIDKITAIKSDKIQKIIGQLEINSMQPVNEALRMWLAL